LDAFGALAGNVVTKATASFNTSSTALLGQCLGVEIDITFHQAATHFHLPRSLDFQGGAQPIGSDAQQQTFLERARHHVAVEHEAGAAEHPDLADLAGLG
jgi:hypothetical protein